LPRVFRSAFHRPTHGCDTWDEKERLAIEKKCHFVTQVKDRPLIACYEQSIIGNGIPVGVGGRETGSRSRLHVRERNNATAAWDLPAIPE